MPTPPDSQHPARSAFVDADTARQAVQLALPTIEAACRDPSICGAGFLCIVVVDPGIEAGTVPFDDAVLYEHAIGDRSHWDADYASFARAKARLAWEQRCDGARAQSTLAHRLHAGDTLLWGSVWLDGIVVGVSGAMQWFDEAFALTVAAHVRALAKQKHAAALAQGDLAARR